MVQNLNNNLITAPELAELRKRLRNLETRVSLPLFELSCTPNACRMVKFFSSHCSGRGATMQLQLSRSVYWLKLTSKLITCSKSCKFESCSGYLGG